MIHKALHKKMKIEKKNKQTQKEKNETGHMNSKASMR